LAQDFLNVQGVMKAAEWFNLPLFSQAAKAHNKTALQIATGDQPLHLETRHDGFACVRIVSQEKTQR